MVTRTRGLGLGMAEGFCLAGATSSAIVADRLSCGSFHVVGPSTALAAVCAIVLLAVMRPDRATAAAEPGTSSSAWRARTAGHVGGAAIAVVMVHLALRTLPFAGAAWLCERPPQLVNDFVAAFGALALLWTCADGAMGGVASVLGLALAAGYAITAPRWHLDPWACPISNGAMPCVSVQMAVLMQLAATAVGVSIVRRRYPPAT